MISQRQIQDQTLNTIKKNDQKENTIKGSKGGREWTLLVIKSIIENNEEEKEVAAK